MKLFVGTSGYAYAEWKGAFYPADLAAKKMLPYYATHFSTVELNHTFYKIPTREQLAAALAMVPKTFRFAVKMPMAISHRKEPSAELLSIFAERLSGLGLQGGHVYWQMPPTLKLDLPRLRAQLQGLPAWPAKIRGGKKLAVSFELPHPSWHVESVRALLAEHGVGFVLVDALSKEGDAVPSKRWFTAPCAYVRLRRPDYDDAMLRTWIRRLRRANLDEAYVYFKHEDAALGPRFAQRFTQLWAGAK
jgi:uncharacterized protein YecE (DUF72 family)